MVEKLRVVIIDDEPLNRAELGDLLSYHPDTEVVGEANDAAGGWKEVEAQAPDLVFLDIRMEGETSGLELGSMKSLPVGRSYLASFREVLQSQVGE
ncbi:MAG: LytR/AlgR family response regulator transcription factor [Gammaproteobacteria bacterium]